MKVAVRCRPMSKKEQMRGCSNIVIVPPGGKTIQIKGGVKISGTNMLTEGKSFTFDNCYDMDSVQEQVYADLGAPIVMRALDGYNGTLFAYGQTGSGKTWSMMGASQDPVNKGVIPRLSEDLFIKIDEKMSKQSEGMNTKFLLTVTFLEIYNEIVKDLLNPSTKQLKIRESPDLGIYVEDLCELVVHNYADVMRLIDQGNTVRKVASTNMNQESSRSHSCFTIRIEQKTTSDLGGGATREQTVKAKLNLVDLAGSERADKTGASGSTLKEGANINLSLMTLGTVINALSEGSKHIPYRDSKLTRLLQESLGGNSATTMLAAISPADYNFDETLGTLKYANRAKSIENAVSKNESAQDKMIQDLQSQIEQLKAQLGAGGGVSATGVETEEQKALRQKLMQMEESQKSSFEERERLSKLLEEERNQNVNSVVGNMMQSVKDKKVTHMKNIKRLQQQGKEITKKQKLAKDRGIELKKQLDENAAMYGKLQAELENLTQQEETPAVAAEIESHANKMNKLIEAIEADRASWLEKKEVLKQYKQRMEEIEEELVDERGELVATSGILEQNDKLRQQIQDEERAKAHDLIEGELSAAKALLAKEKETVRGTVEAEMAETINKMQRELLESKHAHEEAVKELARMKEAAKRQEEYTEQLENRATDAEVDAEQAAADIARLTLEGQKATEELAQIRAIQEETQARLEAQEKAHRIQLEELRNRPADNDEKAKEEAFQMFRVMMDGFDHERIAWKRRQDELQELLKQATADLGYMANENDELRKTLQQAINYEPPIT